MASTTDLIGEEITINLEDLQDHSSVDEGTLTLIAKNANGLINELNGSVGETRIIAMTEAQFAGQYGTDWVLADGRDVTGSKFEAMFGQSTVPDSRGRFLRGAADDSELLTTMEDGLKDHQHTARNYHWDTRFNIDTYFISFITITVANSSSTGGVETRPRNIALNVFIRIN